MNIPSEWHKEAMEAAAEAFVIACRDYTQYSGSKYQNARSVIIAYLDVLLAERAQDVEDNLPCPDGLDESGHIIGSSKSADGWTLCNCAFGQDCPKCR